MAAALATDEKKASATKHIVTSIIGGALLYYAHKNRESTPGRLASIAGASLLGRGISGVAGII